MQFRSSVGLFMLSLALPQTGYAASTVTASSASSTSSTTAAPTTAAAQSTALGTASVNAAQASSASGLPVAGQPLNGLTSAELTFFANGQDIFSEVDSVAGKEPGAGGGGLGPTFNLNSCAGCHAYPAVGGSSPATNPEIAMATRYGARNTVPAFLSSTGPVRVVRFQYNADGTRDGGVHDLFTITGRTDAGSCNIAQPDFVTAVKQGNASFRIPTPVFGAGLIESIQDATILANKSASAALKQQLGISGHENRNGNDGTITRFGWKAQNKSLLLFAGEAYNVEQGVTNEVFMTERDETPGCALNGTPEDHTIQTATTPVGVMSDIENQVQFMRFSAPPLSTPLSASALRGATTFGQIGCALCHTPSMTTGPSSSAALSNKAVSLFSDLLVHKMGPGLADNILQGNAGPDEFRSAPLWGLSQRLFFLHDGRTADLKTAITAHASTNTACTSGQVVSANGVACKSEANAVISSFNALSASSQTDLITFLKSL